MQETAVDNEKLKITKMQEDERVTDQRRHKQNMAEERRQTRDRRAVESDAMLVHRQHRKEMNDTYKNSHERPKMPILPILLMVLVS